jgi:Zn finger protein HypA/HybF involved in hydrogenase expression
LVGGTALLSLLIAAQCRDCHPKQAAAHAKSAHARTLARATDPRWASLGADWAFGAEKQAVTFVRRDDAEHYLELGLSFYPKLGRFDLTPGHSNTTGERYRVFDPSAAILRCFQCHSTGTLQVSADNEIRVAQPGVHCQSCHGDGAAHNGGKGPISNPGKLSAAVMNDQCGACHRKPAPTGGDTDFANPWNVRHQPLYLARSACFLKSGGKLNCITCHDAHSGEAKSVCAGCHAAPKHTRAVSGTCESCHMPNVSPRPGIAFANHWIR